MTTINFLKRIFPVLVVALAWTDAGALVHFDFEQPMFTEPPQPVLDHCVVEQDGVYHLFYLRGDPAVNIGHATTTDFVHWDLQPPVLTTGTWDNKALWAPFLYRGNLNVWTMFYTGVNTYNSQQTGEAISTDLFNWNKLPGPNYHPDPSWAEWVPDGFAHGRDPHVLEYNGRYYLFVTAKTNNNQGAVACAVSDDLYHWQDIGPIYVHNSWHVLESVFILPRNGKFSMFFTEETVNGTSQMVSDSLLSGWDITTRRIIDPGHAPQITPTPWGDMFSRHAVYNDNHGNYQYVLRFSPITWLGDVAAVPRPLPLQADWTFVTGDAFYYQPTWGNNPAVRNENVAKTFVGDGWINTYEYYTGPMGFGSPGGFFGDVRVGVIRSHTFTILGKSMSLLVGGGDYPNSCYVALVDANTGNVLFRETGRNSDEMDRRYWDLRRDFSRNVYIEIADLSTEPFGHICVDDIIESPDTLGPDTTSTSAPPRNPPGPSKGRYDRENELARSPSATDGSSAPTAPVLLPNVPNPFNPSTRVVFEIPHAARVRIDVYDALGAHVRTVVDATRGAGRHDEVWDGRDSHGGPVPSGVYFCRLAVDGVVIDTRKMALLK